MKTFLLKQKIDAQNSANAELKRRLEALEKIGSNIAAGDTLGNSRGQGTNEGNGESTDIKRKANTMKTMRIGLRALLGLGVFGLTMLATQIASAQSYTIDWYKVAGGGGVSTGGTYQVSGTIGQHDAGGPLTGGSYSVTGGFWALIAPVQTPGAPTLYISRGTNSVTVFWQAVPSWTLQQNSSVTAPAGWSASTGVTSSGGTNYLTLTHPTGQLFFRLMNP